MKSCQFRCPPVRPGDIPLVHGVPLGGGWTHLYYAFGYINPTTFEIVDEQDPLTQSLYREFTDLKYKANGPSVRCYPVSRHFTGLHQTADLDSHRELRL